MARGMLVVLGVGALAVTTFGVTGPQSISAAPVPSFEPPLPSVAFAELGRYSTGAAGSGETAAEIVAYEANRLYVLTVGGVDVVDITDPAAPSKIAGNAEGPTIPLPADPTSVAVSSGLVAVSVPGTPRTAPGQVHLFRGTTKVGEVTVGALPDMVTFTPDGSLLAVANEGEPSGYGPGQVDPEGSISVINTQPFRTPNGGRKAPKAAQPVENIRFTDFNTGGSRALPPGVRITGPGSSVAQDVEPEYITVADDNRTAWVSLQENNTIAQIDLRSKTITKLIPLGLSDHSRPGFGIDASDRELSNTQSRINIATWPVRGAYMPDGLANFTADGQRLILTANEGDAREYGNDPNVSTDDYADIARARSVADTTAGSPTRIPAAASDAQLGRLNVLTSSEIPRNGSGRLTELVSFGSRSFSIRTTEGTVVWDSGDDFEQIIARTLPGNFNASNSNNDFENRSDDKGPEPEAVVTGLVGDRQLAFIALERIGGVMVYDITDPTAPFFIQYLTTRDFPARTGGVVGPDSGAEGLLFIPAATSPTGEDLIVAGNEVTGTVNIWGAVQADRPGTLTVLHNNDGESTIEPLTAGGLTVAGVAAYKTVLDQEIRGARNAGNAVLNVYAGDAFLASSTLACSLPPNPPTTPVYDAVAQRQMAYDAHIFGNHEFDFTPDFLERFVRTFERNGTPTQPFLSSNLDFSGEPTWASLLDGDGVIQVSAAGGRVVARSADLVDEVSGMRIGVVGATTPLLPTISSPRNVTITSDDIESTAEVVQNEIDDLAARGVNKIIFVSHLQDISNDRALVAELRGIDLAVAGGGDELLANPGTPLLPNPPTVAGPYPSLVIAADGRSVPIVTTEGNYKYVGRIDLNFDAGGNLLNFDAAKSFPRRVVVANAAATAAAVTDAVVPDPGVKLTAVDPVTACLAALSQPIARTAVPINVSRGVPSLGFTTGVRSGETNGGNLITDGYLRSYDTLGPGVGLPPRGGAVKVVAVQNGGGIRQNAGNVLPVGTTSTGGTYTGVPGPITRRNTLDVMAFLTNSMTVVRDVTPAELDLMLERSGSSLPGEGGQFLQIAGMRVTYSTSGTAHVVTVPPAGNFGTVTTPGSRVREVTLDDGTKIIENGEIVAGAPNVALVTNSFTAAGGDNIAALGLIPQSRKVNLGATYEQTLVDYILSFPVADGLPTIPASDARYANPNGAGRITVTP